MSNPKAYRLPTHALPRRYDIDIDARLDSDDVKGTVDILFDIKESKDFIELHALRMNISEAALKADSKTLNGKVSLDEDREIVHIEFPEKIPTGNATLHLAFEHPVSKGLEGLYLAQDGPERCLCTQCEATAAREIFPCLDEPVFKAQFAWKVTTSPDLTVIANGPLVSTEDSADGKSKTWTFQATKPMSSYLVALVIGNIAGTPVEEVNGTPISVWSMKGKEHMGRFAHDYTKRLLTWYEDYFDLPYHFDKYDQAAVPGFSAGAMENAGLVLFRQNLLLMNPQTASWAAEKRIAGVVAHEFAHMWFGDVVTMEWWDDLWLNESFAEWMAHKVISSLSPEYNIWEDFQGGKTAALFSDALESTHPIYSPVETPAEAAEMFDAITYEKGCAVMRMLETFLGEVNFRNGLRTYMKEFKESNAAGADLWRHLQQASNAPVTEIMQSWVAQGGYPVVTVSLEGNSLRLSQRRFFSKPDAKTGADQLWQVPLIVRYEDNSGVHETRVLLSKRETTLPLEASGEIKWLYANTDEVGFYRQNLQGDLLSKALKNLDKLSPLEQMGLLGDQWGLVRNGTNSMSQFLDVLSAISSTRNYSVLGRVDSYLHAVERLLEDAENEEALRSFREWVGASFNNQLTELGYEPKSGEAQNEAQRRISLVDIVANVARDESALARVREYAAKEAEDPTSVDANLAGLFVGIAGRFGDRALMDRYVEIYQKRRAAGASPQETQRYLNSLTEFEKPELVAHVFELIDSKVVPLEMVGPFIRSMLSQRFSQDQAWTYTKANWSSIISVAGEMWPGFLIEAAGDLPVKYRSDLVDFYEKNGKGLADMSYARALEMIDQTAEFEARTKADLLAWFKNK